MFNTNLLIFVTVLVNGILAHHHHHGHHGNHHGHGACPASESLRRTTHYLCHGYRDGSEDQAQQFVQCVQSMKYKLYDGLQECGHHLKINITMDTIQDARNTICNLHDPIHNGTSQQWKDSFPIFDCLIRYYSTQPECGDFRGCSAKLYLTDDLDYEVLKCYQGVYKTFPEKFDCDD